ncbi:ECF transporter S component [Clostridium luticellarii]|jgi:riboflavin transporter FmnP|uniref:Riboflavin transporter n=1 Tax=Clostridium luticellarii TaxID=1691940 RepID=A0A2T0BQK7_9CLOT|nr:ECF transporter S component [Clostridium luticellarii]MCI1944793.1 ECF transporter S component [Clostridium luticellarii]MCI1968288.1 ECF transporter S component [Clostridium luticellarii]MCI1995675.1 ECF transporter S component [Clostridium luticellarii]MCI2040245.1 ECF transporter S component [Clostridium luticellarii]PRR86163.1 Riboflavin transporter RibU [Clostridium luticellarii]
MKGNKLNRLVKVSLLGVIGFLLMFIEVAVPIFPSFLKIDISDLPALVGTFALGPGSGIAIEFLKNILHGIFNGKTAFIGEVANFAVGSVLVFTAGYIYSKKKTKKSAMVSLGAGTITMSIAAALLNYFILLPLYEKVLNFPISQVVAMAGKINGSITDLNTLVLFAIVPFNLLKGIVLTALTLVLYKSVSPILKQEQAKDGNLAENKN